MPKNFSQAGFTANLLNFMKDLERNRLCCTDFLTQVYTENSSSIVFSGLGTKTNPLTAVVVGGALLGANDGLSVVGTNAVLGGVTLTNKTVDLSVNKNVMWFKEAIAPTAYSQFVVGTADNTGTGQVWGFPHPSILISKSITSDGNNSVFLEMSNPDAATGSQFNGFLFLNYQNVAGQVQPNIRTASNAQAGQGGAYNLDIIGRDSLSQGANNYSHFSIWYYDYDQYFYTNPGSPGPMLNSDFVNFNNGQGGGAGSTRFFMIDKHYNTLLGKAAWNARPAATLDIQDNSAVYPGIYQRGATSGNWFAGTTIFGGSLPGSFSPTYQVTVNGSTQITNVLDLFGLTGQNGDPDQPGTGMITSNGQIFLHLGSLSGNEQFSMYIGLHAGAAVRASNTSVIQSAVAIGYGALQSITGVQQFDGVVIGTGCGQSLTTGSGVVLIGWATGNTSLTLTNSVLIGPVAGSVVNGNNNTFIGTGAGGPANLSAIFTATGTSNNSTIIGAFAGSVLSNVTLSGIILIGQGANKTTNNAVTWTNTTIVGNSVKTDLNNVAMFGSSTQDILLGFTSGTTDNGYRVQINGAITLATTSLPGTAIAGAVETNGTNLFYTNSTPTRQTILSTSAVTASTTNTNTNKIAISIGGTTYYLLASTSPT